MWQLMKRSARNNVRNYVPSSRVIRGRVSKEFNLIIQRNSIISPRRYFRCSSAVKHFASRAREPKVIVGTMYPK